MDVIVIGAGAAGLAAASRLAAHDVDVTVLEARDRIGGRIWTLQPGALQVPVELGAEFLHGETPELESILSQSGLRALDIAGRRWMHRRGRLRLTDDFWERLDRPMRRLRSDRVRDRSFADALAAMRNVPAFDLALARTFVEGFHAADTTRASEQALAEGGSPRGEVRERRVGRVVEGYGALMAAVAAPILGRIRPGTVVTRVRWRPGAVVVESRGRSGERLPALNARAVIVTIPLSVLQATGVTGAIEFDPPLRDRIEAAAGLVMGHVMRVALQLDSPFWTGEPFARHAGDERFDTMSFAQSLDPLPFPVWWTPYPVRAPLLVGWRGGRIPPALANASLEAIVRAAVDSLATILGMTPRAIRRHVVAAFTHDWSRDPFSRGAYSYVGVGGRGASARLARPVQHTVFIAGEHADLEGRNGTVHGAMASGRHAADLVLRAR
jgi:monoamine oxidase